MPEPLPIKEFLDELENVHSLEMYYGDEYLQNLINNARNLWFFIRSKHCNYVHSI